MRKKVKVILQAIESYEYELALALCYKLSLKLKNETYVNQIISIIRRLIRLDKSLLKLELIIDKKGLNCYESEYKLPLIDDKIHNSTNEVVAFLKNA